MSKSENMKRTLTVFSNNLFDDMLTDKIYRSNGTI